VRFKVGEPGGEAHATWAVLYVPSRSLLRVRDDATGNVDWMELSGDQLHAYRGIVRGRQPLPASRLPLATPRRRVGGALPPEVVEPSAVRASAEPGRDALPLLALSLGMVAVVGMGGRWLVLRRR
jgi:hypothetical protein